MIEDLETAVEELEGEEGIQTEGEIRAVIKIDAEGPQAEEIADQEQHADNRPDVPIDDLFGHAGDLRVLRTRGGGFYLEEQRPRYSAKPNYQFSYGLAHGTVRVNPQPVLLHIACDPILQEIPSHFFHRQKVSHCPHRNKRLSWYKVPPTHLG